MDIIINNCIWNDVANALELWILIIVFRAVFSKQKCK